MTPSPLSSATLYGIVDLGYVSPDRLAGITLEMIRAGVEVIQLRAKGKSQTDVANWAGELIRLCRDGGVPFILNDHPELAAELGADGVHVGQDDADMDTVRSIVGDTMLVGRSTHSLEQAAAAAADPRTNYIGFGPLFATPTKPDYVPIGMREIRQVHQQHPHLPVFCIGGIKLDNLATVREAGAKRVVVVSGILQSHDIASYVNGLKSLL